MKPASVSESTTRCLRAYFVGLMLGWAGALACSPAGQQARADAPIADSFVLADPSTLGADFAWRQQIEATFRGDIRTFSAVVQKDGAELLVLGLTPFGSRAFLLRQVGQRVSFTSYVPQKLPFPPRAILVDIHRSLLLNRGSKARADGTHRVVLAGEELTEIWRAGRLRQRRFVRTGRTGAIVIRYPDGLQPGEAPADFTFQNEWYGYTLKVNTLSELPR